MTEINTRIVLRNDTAANWEAVKDTAVLMEGEMGVETDTGLFKLGKKHPTEDRLCTWAELDYANDIPEIDLGGVTNKVHMVSSEGEKDALATDDNVKKIVGDICIVKATVAGDKYSYTSYVWSEVAGENNTNTYAWAAMDGNYSAENVFTSQEIELAGNYGSFKDSRGDTVTVTQIGNKKIGDKFAAGTSLQDIFKGILTQTIQPTKTNPSITITAPGDDGGKETGVTYTKPTGTLTVNAGSYTYGYKDASGNKQSGTGVTFTTAKVAFGADDTITTEGQYSTASNLANGGTVTIPASSYDKDATTAIYTDNTVSYTFSGNASHTAGEVAIDNLGGASDPVVQIAANNKITATDKVVSYRGFRRMFCGCTADALNSSTIRSLNLKNESTNVKGVKAAKGTFEVTAPEGATQIVLALPTKSVGKKYTMTKAEMYTSNWEDYTSLFSGAQTIQVADYRGGENGLQNYNVYTYSFAALKANTRFQFTVAEANA